MDINSIRKGSIIAAKVYNVPYTKIEGIELDEESKNWSCYVVTTWHMPNEKYKEGYYLARIINNSICPTEAVPDGETFPMYEMYIENKFDIILLEY